MSENIEKAVQTEESSETKGTDNVVLYPVSDEEKTDICCAGNFRY